MVRGSRQVSHDIAGVDDVEVSIFERELRQVRNVAEQDVVEACPSVIRSGKLEVLAGAVDPDDGTTWVDLLAHA